MKQIFKKLFHLLPYAVITLTVAFLSIYIFKTYDGEQTNFAYDSIATGIISGIITAFLILIFQVLWKKNINIWIENLLYQDVCIEGEWTGYLVPHMGIKDLDKMQREIAFKIFNERIQRERQTSKIKKETNENVNETIDVEAEEVNENDNKNDTISDVKAEIILHHTTEKEEKEEEKEQKGEKHKPIMVETTIRIKPITVRFEIKRTGHKINGRLIEVSGVNKINSYNIEGLFKNLILSGTYETFNKENMDRGAFSLMLVDNGKKLEGFFSVYNDDEHKIAPLQCVLRKQNKISDEDEVN